MNDKPVSGDNRGVHKYSSHENSSAIILHLLENALAHFFSNFVNKLYRLKSLIPFVVKLLTRFRDNRRYLK